VQYTRWLGHLLRGDWGFSPNLNADVLPALLRRTPATLELTLYSLLWILPLGIISGTLAGWKHDRAPDNAFRLLAFAVTAIPPFVLALVLLAIFYAGLQWFPPGRIGMTERFIFESPDFHAYTGFLTVDSWLNGRYDLALSAFQHLVLPSVTLGLVHWATLGRITRAAVIEELNKDYVMAAHGRGLRSSTVMWRHVMRNAMLPALNSSALSSASLVVGVFVIEIIFDFPGVSELIRAGMTIIPDAPAALGFAIYSVLLVLPLMLCLDLLQAVADPRIREEITAQ